MRSGEIKIEGLGKRYRFRSIAEDFEREAELADPDAEVDGEGEVERNIARDALAFLRGEETEIWALRDVSCHIQPGERVAIIGANGSGKSTLIRILSRTLPPSEGKVEGAGIVLPFAALRRPLSMQNSGCDNLRMLARLIGIPLDHLEDRMPQIVEFSGLGQLAYEKVSRYSDQSFGRLAMAMGLFVDADIYLIDDNVKAGDELYRIKFQEKFAELLTRPVTLVFASNALDQMRPYCRRALWLDRGRLAGDGEINSIISSFLAKTDEIDFRALATGDAAEASASEEPLQTTEAADEGSTQPPADEVAAKRNQKSARPGLMPVVIPPERLQAMTDWQARVAETETAWHGVFARWREKMSRHGVDPIRSVRMAEKCTLATIRSVCCLNTDGRPVRSALPGETLWVDILMETLEPDVTVTTRLELDAPPTLIFVAEPLVPLIAPEPAQYLFRAEIDGSLLAQSFEAAAYKLRTRALMTGADGLKEMMIVTIFLNLRGDLRHAFDEWRLAEGGPATSIVNPTPAFIGAPGEIEGFAFSLNAGRPLTSWDKLNRRPLLRPRLKWTVYRVSPESTPEANTAPSLPALEQAAS